MVKIPEVTYDPKEDNWTVCEDLDYSGCINITVPKGFNTDLASIPRFFWRIIAPFELGLHAPIIHDYLYKNGGVYMYKNVYITLTREEVDNVFLEIMKEQGIGWFKRSVAYRAVRLFGRSSFKN